MRVIAGKKRGLLLASPDGRDTRPTADRVKEALFGSIQFDIAGANVLDLFAGSGALGLEALSRGAREAVLADNNPAAAKTIAENIKRMGSPQNVTFIKNDFADVIKLFHNSEKFDIVLIDPPYQSGLYERALALLTGQKALAKGALLVLESEGELTLPAVPHLSEIKRKKFGRTMLTYFKYEENG
ncbi:MAG TPA: 16S rRNA (guanine(966)-N(2))-methyltransferase RsmD [Clostridiales bacterium]|nr:16S rRNA (guanine(966)-N(2))-methyltransferase RsmD [Clostridiales bacterium]